MPNPAAPGTMPQEELECLQTNIRLLKYSSEAILSATWKVEHTDEFVQWWDTLGIPTRTTVV